MARPADVDALTHAQAAAMKWSISVLSWLSLALAAYTLLSYGVLPRKRRFPSRLGIPFTAGTALLSLAMTFGSLSGYDELGEHASLCTLQALLIQFSACVIVAWWVVGSVNFFVCLTRGVDAGERLERVYLLAACGVPAALTLIPALGARLGTTGYWCWVEERIDSPRSQRVWEWLVFYAWMGLAMVVGSVLWLRSFFLAWRRVRNRAKLHYRRHVVFAASFFASFFCMFLHRLVQALQAETRTLYPLWMLHVVALAMQGTVAFVVFAHPITRRDIERFLAGSTAPATLTPHTLENYGALD